MLRSIMNAGLVAKSRLVKHRVGLVLSPLNQARIRMPPMASLVPSGCTRDTPNSLVSCGQRAVASKTVSGILLVSLMLDVQHVAGMEHRAGARLFNVW